MPIPDLTPDKLTRAAADLGLLISGHEADSYSRILAPRVSAYRALDAIPDSPPTPTYPRTPGFRPEGEANKYNAWNYRTSIKGASEGTLKGKTVALKDNNMLAGAPMVNGASTLQGYICDRDATVVTRILDAGAEIAGKAHYEWFCMAASKFHKRLRTRA
jgi:amidase